MTTDVELWGADDAAPVSSTPHDLEAEKILAASVMARTQLVDDLAAKGFDPADIGDERYRWIWYAVEDLSSDLAAGEIRWEAVARKLAAWHAEGRMVTIPLNSEQLAELYNQAMPGNADYWAKRITDTAVAARAAALGVVMRVKATSPAFDPEADVAAFQTEIDNLIRPAAMSQASTLGDLLPDVLMRAVTPPSTENRIPTGFIDLDGLLCGGWAPGQLVVIGARPAMGKTTIASNFARAAAVTNNIPTYFSSLEMGKDELAASIMCAAVTIPLHHLKQGIVDDTAMARAASKTPELAAAPLHIDDSPLVTLPGLRATVRNLVRTAGLRLLVVDYLQLMQAPRAESRQVAVSMLSRGLKLLAKEFSITVVMLAQLNRGPEGRTDKKPMVSDLRESGSIEQDADIVILLHREDAYEKESPRAGEADLIVGKHRGGPTATITCAFQGHYGRFVDMAAT
ncbi:replicative DNA helicase [Streptomyces malaysiensis]|uniref:Replicative DNA helicase n=1 Tax=Streptomyces malaysiensis subsp. samsunensis TaxID=459658 RepID=A0A9X2LXW1_STRMQ|nr:replicative DNA helicase [Streptomyces samsunensis]MCQ8831828.1 replicative DNA helicase [Streptomyces samsunensis]